MTSKEIEKRERLKDEIKTNIKKVKEVLDELESTHIADDWVDKERVKYLKLMRGKGFNHYTDIDLNAMGTTVLDDLNENLKMTIKSKWSTAEGREEIFQKQQETFKQHGYDLSRDELKVFANVINSNELQRLIEVKVLDSFQVLESTFDREQSDKIVSDYKQIVRTFGQSLYMIKGDTIARLSKSLRVIKDEGKYNYKDIDKMLRQLKKQKLDKVTDSNMIKRMRKILKVM